MIVAGLAALTAFGADVTGKWKARVAGPDGDIDVVMNFKQDGDKLTGSVGGPQGDRDITDGKVEGDKVSFAVERSSGKLLLSGTVAGDQMKLVVDIGDRKLDINARREAAGAK